MSWIAAAAIVLTVGLLAAGRHYFNVNTETDFIGGFIPEAERLVRGERLEMSFHPPGLPILIVVLHGVLGDWLRVGLLLSLVGLSLAVVSSYTLFRTLAGEAAGIGALLGIAASTPLLAFGAQATGDVLFLGLFYLTLAVTAAAVQSGRRSTWALLGLFVGITLLLRTNGIVLVLLLLVPFFARGSLRTGAGEAAFVLAGLLVPVGAWAAYAMATGTPFGPTKNYANLALTYYAVGNRIGAEERFGFEQQFHSSLQVLLHDPVTVARIYLRDLSHLPGNVLREVMFRPLALLGAIGTLVWLGRLRDVRVAALVAVIAASIVLINMKAFEPRYYLFLVPLFGASAVMLLTGAMRMVSGAAVWSGRTSIPIGMLVLLGLFFGYGRAAQAIEDPQVSHEVQESAAAVSRITPAAATLIARKPVVAFYSQRGWEYMPEGTSTAPLCELAGRLQAAEREPYVFVGRVEKHKRPELYELLTRSSPPVGFELRASGGGVEGWRLLRIDPQACLSSTGSPGQAPRSAAP